MVRLFCMKAKFLKNLLGGALVIALILCGCAFSTPKVAYAEGSADYINYVSFGDSIVTGYGLSGYNANADFVSGSFENLFKTYLTNNAKDVNAVSFASDGYTSANLLSALKTSPTVRASVQSADVITVCIGGNDLIQATMPHLVDCFVEKDYSGLEDSLTTAATSFAANLNNIVSEISSLNANAKVVFASIYNPYAALKNASPTQTIALEAKTAGALVASATISGTDLNTLGNIADHFIGGNSALSVTGLNQILSQKISTTPNFYLADVKTAFDSYIGSTTDILRANLTEQTTISLEVASYNEVGTELFKYLDPHPTALGHQMIAREVQNKFAENLAVVTFDYNGGMLAGATDDKSIVLKQKTISAPSAAPTREHYVFEGWFVDVTSDNSFDFSSDVTTNLKLFAKWQAITFKVTFNYNGGSLNQSLFNEVEVLEGSKAEAPTGENVPVLDKHVLVGWFTDSAGTSEFDFSTPITEPKTLYAKWEQVAFDVIFNFGNGVLNGSNTVKVVVDKNSLVTEPAGENLPVYEDHRLTGWYKDAEKTVAWNFATDIVTKDTTIYADWECLVWYVLLNYNGGQLNLASSRVEKVTKGDKMVAPASAGISNDGFVFRYWYQTDETVPFDFENTVISSDITLYARWVEAIEINLALGYSEKKLTVAKDATVGELAIPTAVNTVFFGWFKDQAFTNELPANHALSNNEKIYAKWITLRCTNEESLIQTFSPLASTVEWFIDARAGSIVKWQVNGEIVHQMEVKSTIGVPWDFNPAEYGVGTYNISCLIDNEYIHDGFVAGNTVELNYSVPIDILINLNEVVEKKTYIIEVNSAEYYDASKFVWYKTSDSFSEEFDEEIGRGFLLEYTFSSDCKVCVKYVAGEDESKAIMSNVIKVSVDNYIDTITLVSILIVLFVIALVVVGAVISYRKSKAAIK